jgi:hypothetical protein
MTFGRKDFKKKRPRRGNASEALREKRSKKKEENDKEKG